MLSYKAEAFKHFNKNVGSMVLSVTRNQTNKPAREEKRSWGLQVAANGSERQRQGWFWQGDIRGGEGQRPNGCTSKTYCFILLHLVCHQIPSLKLPANLQYIRSCNAEEGNRYASYFFHFHNTLRIERQFSAIPSRHGFLAFCFPCISKIAIEIII